MARLFGTDTHALMHLRGIATRLFGGRRDLRLLMTMGLAGFRSRSASESSYSRRSKKCARREMARI